MPKSNYQDCLSAETLLDTGEAANYLTLSTTTMTSWRSRGQGPRFVRIGRSIRYRRADLDAFIKLVQTGEGAQ